MFYIYTCRYRIFDCVGLGVVGVPLPCIFIFPRYLHEVTQCINIYNGLWQPCVLFIYLFLIFLKLFLTTRKFVTFMEIFF